ncbi:ABC transporter permease [Salaquimonas pukyongi]|uniref:ABC transporter permease n=1 Tax=Salaquimonas pukyongi TaxID=2712698 RepID=UPI00096BB79F|nr:ABC transporter permease [Salaquimonas pukyongi]
MAEAAAQGTNSVLTTHDGQPLKVSLARALRREKIRALLLIAPLLIFILISFILPIADMLFRSVENKIVADTLPRTVVELRDWDPDSGAAPGEEVFAALYEDLKVAVAAREHTKLGSRLNYSQPGVSSLFRKSGRRIKQMEEGNYKEQFLEIDEDWGKVEIWTTIKRLSPAITDSYFLASVDAERGVDGIQRKPENERIYVLLFARTIFLSLVITVSCILLGYPIAYLLANLPVRTSNMLMILVLLPFWTSLLVRTSAWKVLLQQQGVINDVLVWIGLIDNAGRLVMINNMTGTIIAMTHILLPFMILPLYSVMKTISPTYVRAAKSMGATDWTTFWKIYFPNTIPGIGAGSILVFILAIGYYITPELVGGTSGVFISNRIAYHISSSLNWGLAAALGTILLVLVLALYWVYDRIVGIDNVKLG